MLFGGVLWPAAGGTPSSHGKDAGGSSHRHRVSSAGRGSVGGRKASQADITRETIQGLERLGLLQPQFGRRSSDPWGDTGDEDEEDEEGEENRSYGVWLCCD